MMDTDQKIIKKQQISTLHRVLKNALKYHYENYRKLERIAIPYSMNEDVKIVDISSRMRANTNIKFEVQAYINHLRRLKHFIRYCEKNVQLSKPKDVELQQIWFDILDGNGVINMLANKWAVHRSIDDPKGEDESVHLTVLLNLEGSITMWSEDHMYLSLGRHMFYLYFYHPKVLRFINWVFKQVKRGRVR